MSHSQYNFNWSGLPSSLKAVTYPEDSALSSILRKQLAKMQRPGCSTPEQATVPLATLQERICLHMHLAKKNTP